MSAGPPPARLRKSTDIQATFAARQRARGRMVSVHARERGDAAPARVAVVAGKRVGSAVQRNRAKRRLRGALSTLALPAGRDLVCVAQPATVTASASALRTELQALVAAAGNVEGP